MSSALDGEGNVKPALLPYIRVSTDDKGQDPKRQLARIAPWAEREGFILIGPEEDVGTSASKVAALERPNFIRACERAQAAKAAGLIMEAPDRFSRMDPMKAIWELVEVERRYGLQIWFAHIPKDQQESPMGRLVIFLQLAAANQWAIEHRLKVMSGTARAIAKGVKMGRKPKGLSAAEIEFVLARRKVGDGWELLAVKLNEMRKVHLMTDKKEAKERGVSSGSLRRMAREGIFGDDEKTKVLTPRSPDETVSSLREEEARNSEVVSLGGEEP